VQDLAEVGAVDIGEIVIDPELRFDLVQRMLGHVPLVQGLGRELTGFATLGALRGLAGIRRFGSRGLKRSLSSLITWPPTAPAG
jgi:hypothetical protein